MAKLGAFNIQRSYATNKIFGHLLHPQLRLCVTLDNSSTLCSRPHIDALVRARVYPEILSILTINEGRCNLRRHFQDSLLLRVFPTKELANWLLLCASLPLVRERANARARASVTARVRARRVFVRFTINIKQDGDQEPYEYNSGHLQPSPSDSTNERRSKSSVTEWNVIRETGRNMAVISEQ